MANSPVRYIRISEDLWRKVLELARKAGKTASDIVREALRSKVDPERKTP